jgi:hypothetical protein
VWRSEIDGRRLTFHLAGINDQNFLMRDEQTGTYWQQISGRAISGPLAGRQLTLVPSDELTFALWKSEQPQGTVLNDGPAFTAEYAPLDWDVRMRRARTVIGDPQNRLAPRELIVGIQAFGASRAFVYDAVLRDKVVLDHVGTQPILLVVGPDNQSVRAFRRTVSNDFYLLPDGRLLDSATGSQWDFHGCAIDGKSQGACLERVEVIKDYWFDWLHYNPTTTIR